MNFYCQVTVTSLQPFHAGENAERHSSVHTANIHLHPELFPVYSYRDYRTVEDNSLTPQFWLVLAVRLGFIILFEVCTSNLVKIIFNTQRNLDETLHYFLYLSPMYLFSQHVVVVCKFIAAWSIPDSPIKVKNDRRQDKLNRLRDELK